LQDPSHAALSGDQLADALAPLSWDPSVKSLVPFPQILQMMDDNLGWTERVGNVFLADQAAVMDSIQRLRARAEAAGKLASTSQVVVSTQDGAITIEPADRGLSFRSTIPTSFTGRGRIPITLPMYFPTILMARSSAASALAGRALRLSFRCGAGVIETGTTTAST